LAARTLYRARGPVTLVGGGPVAPGQLAAPAQHHRAPGVPRERVHRREVVVEPPAEKAEADEQRRLDRVEAFFEVGGLLLLQPVHRHPRPLERGNVPQRVEVADDGAEAGAARLAAIP